MSKLGLKKEEELEINQSASIRWIIEKAREFQIIDYTKAVDCVDHNKLWKTPEEMGIPDHLICLLKNVYTRSKS